MSATRIYLDHNATSPLRPAAREAMLFAMESVGNPSSIHGEGRAARGTVERARGEVAALVGADPANIIFTSGATEAAALALTPDIRLSGQPRRATALLRLTTEHPCVLSGGRFAPEAIHDLPVDSNGLIDEAVLDEKLSQHDVPLVAVQLANSETGIVQPVARIAEKVRAKGGYVLCDAVQAAGRLSVDINELNVDFLLLSAHKLGGPQGVGALVLGNSTVEPAPLLAGTQENHRRGGTENVAAIAGFGAAASEALMQLPDYSRQMMEPPDVYDCTREVLHKYDLLDRLHVFGWSGPSLMNTYCFALEGLEAQTALIDFDLNGIAISSGSACSSGKVGSSHVLAAMGVSPEIAKCALRVSTALTTTEAEIDAFFAVFDRMAQRVAARDTKQHSNAA